MYEIISYASEAAVDILLLYIRNSEQANVVRHRTRARRHVGYDYHYHAFTHMLNQLYFAPPVPTWDLMYVRRSPNCSFCNLQLLRDRLSGSSRSRVEQLLGDGLTLITVSAKRLVG